MTTATIEDISGLPLREVETRLNDELILFRAAREAGDVEDMKRTYSAAGELARRREALLASAAPAVPAAPPSAPPAVPRVIVPSTVVSMDEPRDSRPTDDGWSPRCAHCRLSFHDKRVKMVAVRASGIVVKICPSCRKRHPGLAPA
jgi:hypothetical protein